MLCDQVLTRIDPDLAGEPHIDWLDLTWFDCTQRALRKRSRAGVEVSILLPVGQTPRHGDVLCRDDVGAVIAVNLLPTKVLAVRPVTLAQMGRLAIELGNLHVPVEVAGHELLLIPDGPTEALLDRHSAAWQRELRRFVPERSSIAGMPTRAADFAISRTAAATP